MAHAGADPRAGAAADRLRRGALRAAVLGPDALVLTGSSLGNPPFRELVSAAAAGGFAGLSLWPATTWRRARDAGHPDAQLRAMLADCGLVVNDVDAAIAWVGPDDPGLVFAPVLEPP